jgi:hypothetical protein
MKTSCLFLVSLLFLAGCAEQSQPPLSFDGPTPVAPPSKAEKISRDITFASWHQGSPAKRLIRSDEGFCVLTSVMGHFQGGGETVRVYIGKDGYWYVGGHSMQEGVYAECAIIRYEE